MGVAKYKIKEAFPGMICHVYNRGVNRENVFRDDDDYVFYLKKVREYKKKFQIDIICYSWLSNHYHYILEQCGEYSISKFMRSVHTSYGQYFNRKYDRVGPLFQDRFKQAVLNENNFLYLTAYVQANAYIHSLVAKPEDYKWCSYPDYLGSREGSLCNKYRVTEQFRDVEEYKRFVHENAKEFIIKKELMNSFLEI